MERAYGNRPYTGYNVYRRIYQGEFICAGLLFGLPLAWHSYAASGTLENNTRFSETGHSLGIGIAPGLTASFGSVSALNKGFVGSMFLIYHKLWFGHSNKKIAQHLRTRLNDFRFGFSFGWRFR